MSNRSGNIPGIERYSFGILLPLLLFFFLLFFFFLFFLPQPAEYGAEEFSLNAVPTLGSVRIGLVWGGL